MAGTYNLQAFIENEQQHLGSNTELTNFLNMTEEDLDCITLEQGGFSDLEILSQEDTLDIADKTVIQNVFQPVAQFGPPQKASFRGPYNFEVQVNAKDTHKKKYMYSNKLNRIYVDMGKNFSMQFLWDFQVAPRPMFVRATLVFSDESQAQKRVERCLQHKHSADSTAEPLTAHHVLRSTRAPGSGGVYYCGCNVRSDSWYSVLVEFPTVPDGGLNAHSHAYQFVCKNSCNSGINRRAIDIVFTLEDDTGVIKGRQTVGARVCACPKRDMFKDEESEEVTMKRKIPKVEQPQPTSKKIKIEKVADDDQVYVIPSGIQIYGARTLCTGLTVMKNMMEQRAADKAHDTAAQEKIQEAINSIKVILDNVKNT